MSEEHNKKEFVIQDSKTCKIKRIIEVSIRKDIPLKQDNVLPSEKLIRLTQYIIENNRKESEGSIFIPSASWTDISVFITERIQLKKNYDTINNCIFIKPDGHGYFPCWNKKGKLPCISCAEYIEESKCIFFGKTAEGQPLCSHDKGVLPCPCNFYITEKEIKGGKVRIW